MNLDQLSEEQLIRIRRLQRITQNFAAAFAAAFAALRQPFLQLGKALKRLGEVYYHYAENAYKKAHGGKLPGSLKTARLRKKRRDAVLRWHAKNPWL